MENYEKKLNYLYLLCLVIILAISVTACGNNSAKSVLNESKKEDYTALAQNIITLMNEGNTEKLAELATPELSESIKTLTGILYDFNMQLIRDGSFEEFLDTEVFSINKNGQSFYVVNQNARYNDKSGDDWKFTLVFDKNDKLSSIFWVNESQRKQFGEVKGFLYYFESKDLKSIQNMASEDPHIQAEFNQEFLDKLTEEINQYGTYIKDMDTKLSVVEKDGEMLYLSEERVIHDSMDVVYMGYFDQYYKLVDVDYKDFDPSEVFIPFSQSIIAKPDELDT